jgi:hypothetical protein
MEEEAPPASMPPSQTNVVFCRHADLEPDAVLLADATDVLVRAVVGDGFSVPVSWLV